MGKRETLWGFFLGLCANVTGMFLYIRLFSGVELGETLRIAYEEGFLGSLMALGAVLNLLLFFWFIKKRQDRRAKGVLAATLLTALLILLYKVMK